MTPPPAQIEPLTGDDEARSPSQKKVWEGATNKVVESTADEEAESELEIPETVAKQDHSRSRLSWRECVIGLLLCLLASCLSPAVGAAVTTPVLLVWASPATARSCCSKCCSMAARAKQEIWKRWESFLQNLPRLLALCCALGCLYVFFHAVSG